MFTRYTHDELKTRVAEILQQNEQLHAGAIAEQLQVTEGEVVLSLPSELVFPMAGNLAQTIAEALPSWGPVTTIVHSMGSIFEVKAPFPKGKLARGYYNLMGKEGELHGHLRLDLVEHIALVSKPFMGQESYFIGFFAAQGECVFKVYLGRDKQRNLYPEQIEKFQQLKLLVS
ncbi:heme utilization cystosolic carrier protein HutX [Photobacterium kishitanii]|uniref:Heme utilization cystosolic carrier protein HutX n=1 Tax=Photobacterium kishitanii TaxID=318456 RepID=A0A0B7J740_9GAMM|nr:heme utilization cystosolic carrier protein HutX [Photobacterium kishitanii]OBU20550.1 HuvX protein [Photobacterium kishitanii]PSU93714.1 heme utilization cystosolic carrier protein HutX [Photobacterium kishitanii]PSU98965.1 heme utilization cystosolic carrier protein HutX [Photobacterium kishitanii]PSV15275.1 heme utilization cystosolic carrier protein HutX [Photobacterium kishitanii]PSW62494.1 heme utilization cystosolic carrier protein HutX [Photobacterium kishitanii]